MAQFPGSIHDGAASIHTMVLNSRDTLLATGDNFGFVYLWNIDGYCVNKVEEKPADATILLEDVEDVMCQDVPAEMDLMVEEHLSDARS